MSTTLVTTADPNPQSTTIDPVLPDGITKELIELVICIAIPTVAGSLVAISVQKNIQWYETINKPAWAPPTWLFGPVWLILYVLMGLASFLVIRTEGGVVEAAVPLLIYFSNLFLNLAWSPIFFGMEKITAALVDIVLIDATAVAAALLFYNVLELAGYLLIPYLVWLLIATALNYSIYILNPESKITRINRVYPSVPPAVSA